MTVSLDMIRGRSVVVTKTNNSGGGLIAGDVCVQDSTGAEYVTTTTSANSVLKVYVAAEAIASGAAGRFYAAGFCPYINPSASMTAGRYLFTHTVAKQAAENATFGQGAFGYITTGGATPACWLFTVSQQSVGGAGSDTTAIHNNVAGEIAAITAKGAPVAGDFVIIEDSAAANVKKSATLGSFANNFGTIAVSGQSNVVADAINDTLTLAAGTNVTITTNATTDTITIASSGGPGGGTDFLVVQVFS